MAIFRRVREALNRRRATHELDDRLDAVDARNDAVEARLAAVDQEIGSRLDAWDFHYIHQDPWRSLDQARGDIHHGKGRQ